MRELLEKISRQLEAFIEGNYWPNTHILLDEIKAELAKPEPEPVHFAYRWDDGVLICIVEDRKLDLAERNDVVEIPLYTHPAAQQKPLSEDELIDLLKKHSNPLVFARAIEQAHGIK